MGFLKKWNFGYTTRLAESGDRKKAYEVGNNYYEGKIVERDYSEAVKWYADASRYGIRKIDAENNGGLSVGGTPHPQAAEMLARCYRDGIGVEKNDFYAAVLFGIAIQTAGKRMTGRDKDALQASAQKAGGELVQQMMEHCNSSDALKQYQLGYVFFFYGKALLSNIMSSEEKDKKTLSYLTQSFSNGYPDAAWLIARCKKYKEKNPAEALKWLKHGAENNGLVTQYKLGEAYWSGDDDMKIEENKDIAANWFIKVCRHRDADFFNVNYVRKAMAELGNYYRRCKKDYKNALPYLQQAMRAPDSANPFDYIDSDTAYDLGNAYNALGNNAEAKKIFKIGADYYGDMYCMEELGMNSEQIRIELSGMNR